MDVVHHACIGGAGFLGLAAGGHDLAGLGFLVGSVVPDLDAAFVVRGRRFYLKHHQGPTHSLLLAPVYAGMLAGALALYLQWDWEVWLAALAGILAHCVLDLLNTFGVQMLWPLSKVRRCLDAVFFIDAFAWALTLVYFGLVLSQIVPARVAGMAYFGAFATYLVAKVILQRRAKRRRNADFAVPSALNPFEFFLLTNRSGRMETSRYNALTQRLWSEREVPAASPQGVALAEQSEVYRDMRSILRSLHITRVENDHAGTTVIAEDLAVRNFGGRFGRTELRFDTSGRLLHEVAHI